MIANTEPPAAAAVATGDTVHTNPSKTQPGLGVPLTTSAPPDLETRIKVRCAELTARLVEIKAKLSELAHTHHQGGRRGRLGASRRDREALARALARCVIHPKRPER